MADTIRSIRSSGDVSALIALSRSRPVMLLKHSTRCPTSSYAHREFLDYAAGAEERGIATAMVLVVEDRTVSHEIAERLGVAHQSPQAILVRDGRVAWTDSHEGIHALALEEAERHQTV